MLAVKAELGVNVTVSVEELYEVLPDTDVPELLTRVKAIVLAWTASLKVPATVVDVGTPVAPLAGDSLVTVGGTDALPSNS
jgi:hypothetical protein